ncbi:unnamed protein product [Heligmosomoides polygyrus]|uniref:Uncharacterized protein n=1 Tax=Heligmosomoides polygyrus TaxID=6339 RepID=A0A183GUQ6_HELPZ|nr:unnamed protein product [Heligmosomoides polygyrus]
MMKKRTDPRTRNQGHRNCNLAKSAVVHDLEQFVSNPCGLRRSCIPTKWTAEINQRTFCEKYQDRGGDAKYATHDPYKEYDNFLYETERSERLAERDKEATLANFSDYGRREVSREMAIFRRKISEPGLTDRM